MTSSPIWRGGGRAFPNKPDENFTQKVNRKMFRAGMASILSQLVRDGRLRWSRAWGRFAQDQAARRQDEGYGLTAIAC
jgi:ribosomal protein L4